MAKRGMRLATSGFRQSKAMCGPACLKIVADYFGVTVSERRLARLCRTSTVSGTTGANLLRGARALGFAATLADHADFREIERWLKAGIPVIVDWMSTGHGQMGVLPFAVGHYSVVCSLTAKNIILEDPAIGCRRTLPRHVFRNVWFDFTYLHPSSKDDLIIRRLIAVAPNELRLGHKTHYTSAKQLAVPPISRRSARSHRQVAQASRSHPAYGSANRRRAAMRPARRKLRSRSRRT